MITKEELADLMGEDNLSRPSLPNYDIVRLNGKDGSFYRISGDKKENIGQMFEGAIMAVRMGLGEFSKNYYRNSVEFDTFNDKIKIFEKQKNSDVVVPVFNGSVQDAKKQFPGLRARRILYLYLKSGDIVKLVVKGSSLSNLFEFFGIDKEGHLFEYWTRFESEYIEDEQLSYWTISFKLTDLLTENEFKDMSSKMHTLLTTIKKIKNFYSLDTKGISEKIETVKEEIPTINFEEEIEY